MSTLYIDIETANAKSEVLDARMENWVPPSNYKKEATIESAKLKRIEGLMDKAALLNESPIVCIGYAVDNQDVCCISANNEATLLSQFAGRLPRYITDLVGHNVTGFDLPKLRSAFLRHHMPIPIPLTWSPSRMFAIIDTMLVVCRSFNCEDENRRMISLSNACRLVGVEVPPETIKGKDIPALYKAGDMASIVGHCRQDVELTRQLYQKLINLAPVT